MDSHNDVHMHEIIDFKVDPYKSIVPEKFLRHLKINFTHDTVKGEDCAGDKVRVDLAHIQINTIEIVDAEYLIVTYKDRLFFDIFNLKGVQLLRKHLLKVYIQCGIQVKSIDKVIMRRCSNPI